MILGSCCCGAIKFELLSPPNMMGTCHCTRCRKVGASVLVFVERTSFRWIQGEESVAHYLPEPPYQYTRCFCKKCGTALGEPTSQADMFPIAANCLDSDLAIKNQFHEFIDEKPTWYHVCDDAKQFAKHPVSSNS